MDMDIDLDPDVTDFEIHLRAAVKAELSDKLDIRIKELPRDRELYLRELIRLIVWAKAAQESLLGRYHVGEKCAVRTLDARLEKMGYVKPPQMRCVTPPEECPIPTLQ